MSVVPCFKDQPGNDPRLTAALFKSRPSCTPQAWTLPSSSCTVNATANVGDLCSQNSAYELVDEVIWTRKDAAHSQSNPFTYQLRLEVFSLTLVY